MKSSLYVGRVRHRRFSPREHEFTYQVAMFYIDLSEIDQLFRVPFLFSKGPALLQFRRSDYHGDPTLSIDSCVRELVLSRTGQKISGPIRLLTQLRYLGVCFNPVSFYYCYDDTGDHLKFIVAEITNTPWNERHCYVLSCDELDTSQDFLFKKDFHVSPFLPMDMIYGWSFSRPKKTVAVHMENFAQTGGDLVFDATMSLHQRALSVGTVALTIVSFPLLTIKTVLAIYWQALLLKLKGMKFYPHPSSSPSTATRRQKV
jgi:DUF1365 family protein